MDSWYPLDNELLHNDQKETIAFTYLWETKAHGLTCTYLELRESLNACGIHGIYACPTRE